MFASLDADRQLSELFAQAITQRSEGLVLKDSDGPYFSAHGMQPMIKLNKDYIQGLGHTADLNIIGGFRDATDEQELNIGKLWWTSFYIGCLENKDDVCRFDSEPVFRIVDIVGKHSISKENMSFLNRHGYFRRVSFDQRKSEFGTIFQNVPRHRSIDLFKPPFTVEMLGAGFDKPANTGYFTLRFPRMLKVHDDRSFKDAVSFQELQGMARQCQTISNDRIEEPNFWRRKLQEI